MDGTVDDRSANLPRVAAESESSDWEYRDEP